MRSDEYRRYAQECYEFANAAENTETKAVYQLTAEAWTMLAAQVETLEGARGSEATRTPQFVQSTA